MKKLKGKELYQELVELIQELEEDNGEMASMSIACEMLNLDEMAAYDLIIKYGKEEK